MDQAFRVGTGDLRSAQIVMVTVVWPRNSATEISILSLESLSLESAWNPDEPQRPYRTRPGEMALAIRFVISVEGRHLLVVLFTPRETPRADPHAGCCGGRGRKTPDYPIMRLTPESTNATAHIDTPNDYLAEMTA